MCVQSIVKFDGLTICAADHLTILAVANEQHVRVARQFSTFDKPYLLACFIENRNRRAASDVQARLDSAAVA